MTPETEHAVVFACSLRLMIVVARVAQVSGPQVISIHDACAHLISFFHTFYFHLLFTVSSYFLLSHLERHSELDNLIAMENLRDFAKRSNDAYDVPHSFTGEERVTAKSKPMTNLIARIP